MSKKTIKKLLTIIMFVITMWLLTSISNAAYISIKPSASSGKPGQTISVTISSDSIGKASLSVSNGTISKNSIFIDGSETVSVTLGSSGKTTITVTPIDMSDKEGNPASVPVSSSSITITSNKTNETGNTSDNTPTKSTVATLANLGIKGEHDFSGFKPNTFTYNKTVPNDVETVEIYASKGQTAQKITGTGVKELQEGENSVNIVVTAEDGKTQKTYTINITREAKKDNNEDENEGKTDSGALKELKLGNGLELEPNFQPDIYEYKVNIFEDIDKIDLTAIGISENDNIEITGNENLQEGENIITIIVKNNESEETYTYQIIVNKTLKSPEVLSTENNDNNNKIIIISGIVAACIIVIIVVIIVIKRLNRDDEEEYSNINYKFDENEETDINTNISDNSSDFNEEKPRKRGSGKGKRYK